MVSPCGIHETPNTKLTYLTVFENVAEIASPGFECFPSDFRARKC